MTLTFSNKSREDAQTFSNKSREDAQTVKTSLDM